MHSALLSLKTLWSGWLAIFVLQILSVFINLVYICFLEQFFRLALSRLQNCGLSSEEDR